MTKKNGILLIMSTLMAFMFALAVTTVARAEDPPPPPTGEPANVPAASEAEWGVVNDSGTHFEIIDRGYLDMTLDSSEAISLTLQSFPNQISIVIRPISEAPSTQITLSGLLPSTTYYQYEDGAKEPATFTTDASGGYVYTQDLAAQRFVRIQTHKSTLFLEDDATGGDCDAIGNWNWPTKTCTLSQDVNDTIRINGDGITLDGAGYTIDYYGGGVQILGVDNATVKNLNITDTTYAYYNSGIYLYGSVDNTIEAVNVANMYYGIYLDYANGTVVADNTLSNNRYGLLNSYYTYYSTISNNNLSNNSYAGLYLYYSSSNTISGNTISDGGYDGMLMYESPYNTISDNTISGNPNYGVFMESYGNGNYNNVFSSNTISNSYIGVYLSCYYCSYGYDPNTYNTFSYNTISNHAYGVYDGAYNTSVYNTYHHNTIANNSDHGMYLNYSSDNTIYNNDFVDNSNQVWDGYGAYNSWNLAAPTGGNYWSNYDTPAEGCDDVNSDSFCDIKLWIASDYYGYDYLPLTSPANQQQQSPEVGTDAAVVTVNEGVAANNSGTVSDPDGDTVTLSASTGTVTNNNDGTWSWSFDSDDGPDETQTIMISADDGSDNTASTSFDLIVVNVEPAAILANDGPIDEGSAAAISFSGASDASSADTSAGFHYAFDCSGGSLAAANYAGSGTVASISCPFADNGSYTVSGKIMDKDDGAAEYTTTVVVNNVAPVLGSITVDQTLIAVDSSFTAGAVFTDPGVLDMHTAAWDWGDGTEVGSVTQGAGSGSVSDTHSYSIPGVYTVKLTVSDNLPALSNESTYEFVVVYDPSGGFVTGGGWIMSPIGACKYEGCTDDTTGKANFGFVAKYKKGANTPDGNTEFQFKAGGINFQSSSYDWLVVAGAKAKYKGLGTINGAGSYGFMLTATDSDVQGGGPEDSFRIKIWDKNDGDGIVYDNKMGAGDDGYDGTALGGGNIKIHKAK